MARDVNATTIQSNILTSGKDYTNFSYFLGGVDVTQKNLDQFTPYIPGVARIFLHTEPIFMKNSYPELTKNFKSIVETGYTRVSGISDLSVQFADFQGGFNAQKYSTVSSATDDTESFTVSVYEQSGSPVREYLDTWVTGTRDPLSGIAHYHDSDTVYGEKNHTAEFIYMVLDPTAKKIEYACLFAQCFPTRVPKDHLNYESGNRDGVLLDLEFRARKYESPQINSVAKWYLENSKMSYNYLNFDSGITEADVKLRATDYSAGR